MALRAATSYARWLQRQGRGREGAECVAAIYGEFTQGFETGVLREARRLLEELGGDGRPADLAAGPAEARGGNE